MTFVEARSNNIKTTDPSIDLIIQQQNGGQYTFSLKLDEAKYLLQRLENLIKKHDDWKNDVTK